MAIMKKARRSGRFEIVLGTITNQLLYQLSYIGASSKSLRIIGSFRLRDNTLCAGVVAASGSRFRGAAAWAARTVM